MNYPEQMKQQAEKMAYLQQTQSVGGLGYGVSTAPIEPGPISKAHETMGYIRELESAQRELRLRLFGPFPESAENTLKNPQEPCLEDLLREICQRSAMAVGELKSILGRL